MAKAKPPKSIPGASFPAMGGPQADWDPARKGVLVLFSPGDGSAPIIVPIDEVTNKETGDVSLVLGIGTERRYTTHATYDDSPSPAAGTWRFPS